MSKRNLIIAGLVALAVLIAGGVGLGMAVRHYARLPEELPDHETLAVMPSRLVPASNAAMLVTVRDVTTGNPVPDADIVVKLKPSEGGRDRTLFEGTTDALGTAEVAFQVPDDVTGGQLVVETRSPLGRSSLESPVSIERDYRILLSTDKPLYQPGQIIHLRALALSAFDLIPASGQSIEFSITDGKGNRVYRETVTTSEYGVAAVDFQLADEVNTGPYNILATMGNTSSEKTVTVERYVLPKFDVQVTTERNYYLPGQRVSGHLQADYFFGKPVDQARVAIEGFTFDVEREVVVELEGTTDEQGGFDFDFDLPTYIAGTELEGGAARFYVQVAVTDQTNHTEERSVSLPVAQNAIVIDAMPESGMLRPGIENIVYILAAYPDGTPAPCDLTVEYYGQPYRMKTGEYGLAEWRITPSDPYGEFHITARDAAGNFGERWIYSEGEWQEEYVLLRPDRATYQVGDTMTLSMFTSQPSGTVYLDIVREGQTVSTRAIDVEDGKAEVAVDLSPDLFGTLELHAYKFLSWGAITRDTRLVVVDQPSDLSILVEPDQEVYLPGSPGTINFTVSDQDGQGVASALGVAIVDEAVFALAEQDPGFAKLYFMLEAELLTPRYDLHGFSVPDLVQEGPSEDPQIRQTQQGVAQASLAAAAPVAFIQPASSRTMMIETAYERQANFFNGLFKVALPFALVLPLLALTVSVIQVRRDQQLGRSLMWAGIGLVVALILGGGLICALSAAPYFIYGVGPLVLILPLGLGLLALIAAGVIAVVRRDWALGVAALCVLLYLGVVTLVAVSAEYARDEPPTALLIGTLIAFLGLPAAFGLRAAGFGRQKRVFAAVVSALVAVPVIFGIVVLVASAGAVWGNVAPMRAPVMGAAAPLPEEEMMQGMADAEMLEEAAPSMEAPAEPEAAKAAGEGQATPQEPRLRQYFPETMYWNPEVVTDAEGNVALQIDMADSITTWRLSALASSQDGRLGATTAGVRVFQDFFIDLDLPLALTQNDEISVPVGVFNYLPKRQTVRLELDKADWFELLDEPEKEITIEANDIEVVYFRVRAVDFGRQPFTVTAYGPLMSDAIRKEVTVYPDGKEVDFSTSGRLSEGISQPVEIPQAAIPGTQKLIVKVYPGVVSQVVEGLDALLRMPSGCFEQTSSSTYPNVLVLDYLKTTDQASPEVQFQAEDYINLGYQRLTTFEVSGGGFSLFGDAPADRMLTAYGLQEFSDMSRVHDVDQAIIDRAAEWLISQQDSDGSWANDQGLVHEDTWQRLENDRVPVTAYIVWSLTEAGYGDHPATQAGLSYVREHLSQANDPYVVALVANALVAAAPDESFTSQTLDRLASMAKSEGDAAYWASDIATFMGAQGQTGSIETTALATYALLRANSHSELANAGLIYLVQEKDSFGTWYSTQATILSLKALLESVRVGGEDVNATVTVTLNGGQARTLQITPENFDVVQLVAFDDVPIGRENVVEIEVSGKGNLMYQVTGSYYLPWQAATEQHRIPELVTIEVDYDRTSLRVDDTAEVLVTVQLNQPGLAETALIDLGVPPGFSVVTEDLNALVARYQDVPPDYAPPIVERYELTGRQVLIYIRNLTHTDPLTFRYRLRAKFPITAQTPPSNVYDYYNPDVAGVETPQLLVVQEQ
jgi:uncharacterized protein YfaS (alpha-2-macroglobulin family)